MFSKKNNLSGEGRSDQSRKGTERHTIVQLAGSGMKLLLPDGYERLKRKNPVREAVSRAANTDAAFRKTVASSDNMVLIFRTSPERAMDPADLHGLIDGIHRSLSDTQGIIEARNGFSARGYKYIYSIVKNLPGDISGVRYFLRLNIFHGDEIIEINADFTEIGTTGMRENTCAILAQNAGIANVLAEGFPGWTQDPYDPGYTKGQLKNLAEKEGLDGLFPENPLSQAHEFLLAVLRDEFVTTRQDVDNAEDAGAGDTAKEDEPSTEDRAARDKAMLRSLFVDECKRYTFPVVVEVNESARADTEGGDEELISDKKELRKKRRAKPSAGIPRFHKEGRHVSDSGGSL